MACQCTGRAERRTVCHDRAEVESKTRKNIAGTESMEMIMMGHRLVFDFAVLPGTWSNPTWITQNVNICSMHARHQHGVSHRTRHARRKLASPRLKHAVVKRKLDVDRARVLVQPAVLLQRFDLVLVQLCAVGQRQERREPVVFRRKRESVREVAELWIVLRRIHIDRLSRRRGHAPSPGHLPLESLLLGVVILYELAGVADFVEVRVGASGPRVHRDEAGRCLHAALLHNEQPADQHVVVHHKACLVGFERFSVVPIGREDIWPDLILQTEPHTTVRNCALGQG
eukprot:3103251-Rhodomonas_salina.1